MKNIVMGLGGLLLSSPLYAHVGEHGHFGWLTGAVHLLEEHGYLLLAIVVGGLVFRQLFHVRG